MFFRKSQRVMDNDIDSDLCSPADYTIMIRNIPKGLNIDYEQELMNMFTYHAGIYIFFGEFFIYLKYIKIGIGRVNLYKK